MLDNLKNEYPFNRHGVGAQEKPLYFLMRDRELGDKDHPVCSPVPPADAVPEETEKEKKKETSTFLYCSHY